MADVAVPTTPDNPFTGVTSPPTGTATVTPALPAVPSDPNQLKPFLEKMKEIVEVFNGNRGNKFDQVVTWREMFNHGLVDMKFSGQTFTGKPDTPFMVRAGGSTDYTMPPAPTNLTAGAALANIILDWNEPTFLSYAYTEIWRSDTDNVNTASLIGQTSATVYADNVGQTNNLKYYWVRFVNQNNVVGPFNASAGVSATTARVATNDISDASITNAKIANLAVDGAKIASAAIVNAKIADAAITTAKISDAAITTAKIGDAAITAAKIGDAEITSAKIADTIQSTNYSAVNKTGWQINKDGNVNLNNAALTAGTVQSTDGKFKIDLTNKTISIEV